MNTFLNSYKENRWKDTYYQYKASEEKGTSAYYITVPPNDEKAFELVENTIAKSVNESHVVGINVTTVVDIFDNSKMNQIIRFDYDKDYVYVWNKPEGSIS